MYGEKLIPLFMIRSSSLTQIRVCVVDDHALFRECIVDVLNNDPGFCVVGEADDGSDVLDMVRESQPDVLLLDISLPGKSGLAVAKEMAQEHLDVPIVMLTMYRDERFVSEAFASGVKGYVLKEDPDQEVINAIRAVCAGRKHLSRWLSS